MTTSAFRALSIGDRITILPDITNTVTNQYIRVIDGQPQSFVCIDQDDSTPIPETIANVVSPPAKKDVDTSGFESIPCVYVNDYTQYYPDDYLNQ